MIRGWIIFGTLVISTSFKAFRHMIAGSVGFLFHEEILNRQSWVYYGTEHLNFIGIAIAVLIKDQTPRSLLILYLVIEVLDLIHFILFYRDDGLGFNLFKVLLYGIPLTWMQVKYSYNSQ